MKSISKTTDEYLLAATMRDVNEFFDSQKLFLLEYYAHLKEATLKADRMTSKHKGITSDRLNYRILMRLLTVFSNYW